MRRLRWVLAGLLLLALVEIVIFIWVAGMIGWGWAFLAGVLLSLFGAVLLRREGVRAWRTVREASRASTPPGEEVLGGAIGLAAALLLLIPGFLTALVGLLLLAPPLRRAARHGARRLTENKVPAHVAGDLFGPRKVRVRRGPAAPAVSDPQVGPGAAHPTATGSDEVIEGEIVD